ncbi:PIG-L deacetylase family protein [Blastococcus sp. Marseille-P5729]|uniref:PIG-L deacetylase family protein n=1 Tax=Blastococcus sp. Marseille-P5729 TaxID=2086582 RepID=UPI000D0FFC50|nr:PIG-L family deacetylase [Blastococcus sp. Marseille-P5729]
MIRKITPDGHADAVWRPTLDGLPRTAFACLMREIAGAAASPRLLVVSAHPDDETLGGGRLIADWVAAGGEVGAVIATDGEACFDVVGHDYRGIADIRAREWGAALEILGAQPLAALGLPDGGLAEHERDLAAEVAGVVADFRPDVIAGTIAADPHPDHQVVGRVVEAVAREQRLPRLGWPVWLTYFADPPGPCGLEVVECSADAEQARQRAWECFDSQRSPVADDLTAVVPPQMVELLSEQLVVRGAST